VTGILLYIQPAVKELYYKDGLTSYQNRYTISQMIYIIHISA